MTHMTARRLAAVLALAGFLCTVALAAADVVRISPPWTVAPDADTFVQVDDPAEPLPPPVEEDYYVPAAPPADEPEPQKSSRRLDRDAKRDKRDERDERDVKDRVDQANDAEESRDRGGERRAALPRERIAGTFEDVSDLGEEALPEPLCGDPEACLTVLSEGLGCDSFASCEELYLGEPEDGEEGEGDDQEPLVLDRASGDDAVLVDGQTEEPILSCDSEESCAALLGPIFGCDSFEACERLYLGVIVPDDEPAARTEDDVDEAPTALEQSADL